MNNYKKLAMIAVGSILAGTAGVLFGTRQGAETRKKIMAALQKKRDQGNKWMSSHCDKEETTAGC